MRFAYCSPTAMVATVSLLANTGAMQASTAATPTGQTYEFQKFRRSPYVATCEPPVDNQSWYALHIRHQHEKTAARILENQGYEFFLPLYTARHKWQDRIKQVALPLFPGYMFVREGRERWLQILKTPGVCSFVACAGRPMAIPFSEIEGVRRIVESTLSAEPHPFLRRGDCVRIKFGPLAGLEGILVRKDKRTCLIISVEMLGRSAAVEVDAASVERIVGGNLRTRSEPEGRFVSSRANRPATLSPAKVG
jgi:transcription termination/antitermination protein NusG